MQSLVLRHEIQDSSHLLARGLYVNRLVFAPFRAIQMLKVIHHTLLQQQAQRNAHPIPGIYGRRQYGLSVRLGRTYHHRHASRPLVDAQSLVGSRYLAQSITQLGIRDAINGHLLNVSHQLQILLRHHRWHHHIWEMSAQAVGESHSLRHRRAMPPSVLQLQSQLRFPRREYHVEQVARRRKRD